MDWLLSIPSIYRWLITLTFVAVVVVLSVAPGVEQPDDAVFVWLVVNTATPIQKAMHVAVYALLVVLWMWTLQSVVSPLLRVVLALVAAISLGAILEWHQTRVPGHYGTILDVLLNSCGALAGIVLALLVI